MSKYKIFGSTTQELKLPQDKPQYNLDLVNSQSIPPEYTFTRNSSGTYVGADGYIKTAAANEPRFEYDVNTSEFKGLLVEESRTNYNTNSLPSSFLDFSRSIKTTGIIAPDGTNTAINYNNTGGTLDDFVYKNFTLPVPEGTSYVISIFSTYSNMDISQGGLADGKYNILSSTQHISYGNGWYRHWRLYSTITNNANTTPQIVISTSGFQSNQSLWGLQVEVGSFPTSYIPTSGSAVTRQPDQLILNRPFNSLGTFFVEATTTAGTTLSADNGTSSILMSSTGKEALYYNTNGTLTMSSNNTTPVLTNTTTPPQNLNRVSLGHNALDNSSYINGYLKKFMYYGSPVTEDNLRSLTSNTKDTYRSDIVTNSLVLYLDAAYYTGGNIWTDLSGNGNDGTLVNGVGYDSGNGGSLVFDGINDYVGFNSYNFGNELTVFCFIRPSSVNNISTIFANSIGGAETNGIRLFLNNFPINSRRLTIEIGNGTSSFILASSNDIIEYDKWQQVAFTLSKTAAVGAMYLNGTSVRTGTLGVTNYNSNAVFRLGAFISNNFHYKGRISNTTIYNRALTQQEIQQNFNALRGRFGI